MNLQLRASKALIFALLLISSVAIAQTPQERQQIIDRYDQPQLSRLNNELANRLAKQKQEAIQMARQKGWQVRITTKDGRLMELQRLAKDGSPIYYTTYNVDAARSTRTDHLNIGGSLGLNLDGQNMTAHVWDGGLARGTHQEYDGPGGNNRFSIGDGSSTLNFHAAHVTGTIIASGVVADAKGMAPQASAIGYDWNSDIAEATTAASNGMLVSNHSYGFRSDLVPDQYFGAYISESRNWDQIMHDAPFYLMVVAAGNDGNTNYNAQPLDGQSAYDKLTGHSTSKNNLVVANAQDANVGSNGNLISVTINSSSSEGPTDDYRIKPDISGNGTGVYSTYESSDTAYNSITGTSMASPNVAGSLVLLQQHANNTFGSFMRASTLKGLALHTADDAGPTGPDPVYGWGLLNAKRAAEAISAQPNGNAIIDELTLSSGQSYTINVEADGINDLVASISWTDLPGTATSATNSNTAVLVNDLDIRVTKGGTTYFPWRLTGVTTNGLGDNTKDPYERITVGGATGTYTVTVTHKGSLSGGSQNYSLILTGVSSTPIACTATTPTNVSVSGVGSSSATIGWDSVSGATFDVRYRQTGTSNWTTVAATGVSATLSGLTPLTEYEAQVRSKCDDGTNSAYSSSVTFTTTEVQLNYCGSQGNSINDEYIGRVQLGSIDNSAATTSGYTDFTSLSTDLTKGDNYTITVTPTWTGTVYAEGYSVWIDYNKDGDFGDAGEQVWTQSTTTATPVSGSFTVPTSAVDGATRMRVSMKYNGVPTACETFAYGEVEDYTVNLTNSSGGDTQAPTAPGNLSASNVTQTTVDLSWNASTDNVGVTEYVVYQDGSSLGTVTGTGAQVTGLAAGSTYQYYVTARDAAGNESSASNTISVTTQSSGGGGPVEDILHQGFFESGWDGWVDGGSDAARYSGSRSYEGSYSIRLRDNSGTASSMTIGTFDVTAYDTIEINFFFYAYSMENGEDFWVRYNDGSGWATVASYARGTDFNNNTFYEVTIILDKANFVFPTNAQFRIQCDASANGDQVYVDQVTIKGISGATNAIASEENDVRFVSTGYENYAQGEGAELEEFSIYPNPVSNMLNVALFDETEATFEIHNLVGQVVKRGNLRANINVSDLQAGIYLMRIDDGEEVNTQKFIKE